MPYCGTAAAWASGSRGLAGHHVHALLVHRAGSRHSTRPCPGTLLESLGAHDAADGECVAGRACPAAISATAPAQRLASCGASSSSCITGRTIHPAGPPPRSPRPLDPSSSINRGPYDSAARRPWGYSIGAMDMCRFTSLLRLDCLVSFGTILFRSPTTPKGRRTRRWRVSILVDRDMFSKLLPGRPCAGSRRRCPPEYILGATVLPSARSARRNGTAASTRSGGGHRPAERAGEVPASLKPRPLPRSRPRRPAGRVLDVPVGAPLLAALHHRGARGNSDWLHATSRPRRPSPHSAISNS